MTRRQIPKLVGMFMRDLRRIYGSRNPASLQLMQWYRRVDPLSIAHLNIFTPVFYFRRPLFLKVIGCLTLAQGKITDSRKIKHLFLTK